MSFENAVVKAVSIPDAHLAELIDEYDLDEGWEDDEKYADQYSKHVEIHETLAAEIRAAIREQAHAVKEEYQP